MYEVEPGFEIPSRGGRVGNGRNVWDEYPFDKMEAGDSFLIESTPEEMKKQPGRKSTLIERRRSRVMTASRQYAKKADQTFKATSHLRHQEQDGETGLRVWRVKPAA
ncbi:MAG: hypothetical protein KAU50_06740 [Candidatus Marinimicrobia bacterium]|nr:hypothetical protein [Candidatus Neomarinimicrobiota bacterium]